MTTQLKYKSRDAKIMKGGNGFYILWVKEIKNHEWTRNWTKEGISKSKNDLIAICKHSNEG